MNLEIDHKSTICHELLILKGNLTVSTMSMVTTEFNRIAEMKSNKYLILDLSKIEFIDSNGLGLIVKEGQKLKNTNSILYLLNPSKNVLKILRETNMIKYFPIIDKIDQISH